MKKILGIFFFTALAFSLNAEYLCITTRDAQTPAVYRFEAKPKVTFEKDEVIITADEAVVRYSLKDYVKFTFLSEYNSLDQLDFPCAKVSFANGTLSVEGIEGNGQVQVYALNGALVRQGVSSADGKWEGEITPGSYIIKLVGRTIKITIK